jgi:hypothetical protein
MTAPDAKTPAEIEAEERRRPETVSTPPEEPEALEEQVRHDGAAEQVEGPKD